MKRLALGVVISLVASMVALGQASAQEPTTTTAAPTTTAPPPTTTAPPPTTTAAPPTTVPGPAPTTTLPDIELPGEHIESGSLTIGSRFKALTQATCQMSGPLAGQEMNLVRNETTNIGAVYGKAVFGPDTVGMVMVQLGPLPTAILAYRSLGVCEHDVVAIGGYGGTPTSASFTGIGFGAYPGDYADNVTAQVTVSQAGTAPNLDIQSAYDFMNTPRAEP